MTETPKTIQTTIETLAIGEHSVTLETASNFDELLDYYAEHHPETVDLIPYYAHLWDSARGLCDYLVAHPSLVRGASVLELGCGLALPSLLASKLGAAQVAATDFHPDVGPFVARNIAHNNLSATMSYAPYNWQDEEAELPILRSPPSLLLASDVLYEAEAVDPFAARAATLCPPSGTILLADPGRTRLEQAVDRLTAAGFDAELSIVRDVFVLCLTRA
jgi:predicted nicotinamide N-methyase